MDVVVVESNAWRSAPSKSTHRRESARVDAVQPTVQVLDLVRVPLATVVEDLAAELAALRQHDA